MSQSELKRNIRCLLGIHDWQAVKAIHDLVIKIAVASNWTLDQLYLYPLDKNGEQIPSPGLDLLYSIDRGNQEIRICLRCGKIRDRIKPAFEKLKEKAERTLARNVAASAMLNGSRSDMRK